MRSSQDPERMPAMDFGHTYDVKEHGKVVGQGESWFLESEQASVELIDRGGVLTAFLEGHALVDE